MQLACQELQHAEMVTWLACLAGSGQVCSDPILNRYAVPAWFAGTPAPAFQSPALQHQQLAFGCTPGHHNAVQAQPSPCMHRRSFAAMEHRKAWLGPVGSRDKWIGLLFTCLAEHRTPVWPVALQAVSPERRGRPVLEERGA